jgi:peptidoglycan hydrolase-like protein with peptidoglycan-binding domain
MRKKILSVILGTVFAFGILILPVNSSAVSGTSTAQNIITTLQAQITQLIAQIEILNSQIAALKQTQKEIKETTKDIKSTLSLARHLRRGMSGDDIKTLQEFLATDPSIYPEGLITGYFGPLTEKAVKKFQEHACIDTVGLVGPQTMARINRLLDEGAGKSGEHSANETDSIHVPAGLLRAPGIQKKLCGNFEDQDENNDNEATTTLDTTAPVISDIKAGDITSSTAKIEWETGEKTNGQVWYGTGTPVVTATPTAMVSSADFVKEHSIALTGLTASTTYYYVAVSADKAGNTTTSGENSFATLWQ